MRRWLWMGVAGWVAMGATPALAEVDVFAEIFKDKDVLVTESIDIEKDIDLEVDVDIDVDKSAEALSLVNQDNFNNEACTNCDEKTDTIVESGNLNDGVLNINQAAGNMNNQGNAVSVAVDVRVEPPANGEPIEDPGFAEAQASAEQFNEMNTVDAINVLFRDAFITDSLNDNTGVVGANQSPGNMNNQANVVSVALALSESGVALSEADLGQFNIAGSVFESDAGGMEPIGINKTANISGSVNNNAGIVGVNQSVGNMANQANVASLAFVAPATNNQ